MQYKGQRLRNCALLGMTAGLAAFFGVALGGELLLLACRSKSLLRLHSAWHLLACMAGSMCCSNLDSMDKASSLGGPAAATAGLLLPLDVALLQGTHLGHCAWPMTV